MKVAIFGAGTMGSGIAQVFAAKGHTALMYASSPLLHRSTRISWPRLLPSALPRAR